MSISHAFVGTVPTADGKTDVESYTLDNGHCAIEVWTYGARLVEVRAPDRHGRRENVVLRMPDLAGYADPRRNAYLGATVGRYCRCIAGGSFRLGDAVYPLTRNAGDHHIHGGETGFDRRVWTAEAGHDNGRLTVCLQLSSPDGDQGYPGALSAQTCYHLDDDSRLTFEHSAVTTEATVAGFTNHAFWNLAGTGTVNAHLLAVNASRMILMDSEFIPLPGPPVSAAGTVLDYSTARPIARQRIDNFFVIDDSTWAVELSDQASGRVMRVVTDEPGVGIYTADHYHQPRAGICLEAGPWPDAPNRPDFPSARLDPGGVYHRRTVHEFSVR